MSDFEFACYALAERLHMSVQDVKRMPFEEFSGWCQYLERRDKEANPSMLDSPDNMLKGFAGFGI
jgi:hypothetical protein